MFAEDAPFRLGGEEGQGGAAGVLKTVVSGGLILNGPRPPARLYLDRLYLDRIWTAGGCHCNRLRLGPPPCP